MPRDLLPPAERETLLHGDPTEALGLYQRRLLAHDWTYEMADDYRVWEQGRASEDALGLAATLLEARGLGPQATVLYRSVAPGGGSSGPAPSSM